MIGKVFGALAFISFVCAIFTGNMTALSNAVTASANDAVNLVTSMVGSVCLWSGVARVLEDVGFTELLRKIVSPVLKAVYTDSCRKNNGISECASSICANFLGLGNAALPLGIATMKKFGENDEDETKNNHKATDDQVMFAVLATVPFQLLPVTLAAMREASGSASPYEILIPIWICEVAVGVFAVIICKLLARVFS